MSALSGVNSNDSNRQHTKGIPPSQPTRSLYAAPSASMLQNAKNIQIKKSRFTTKNSTTYNVSSTASLDLLHKAAAPNAILNSGGRADEVRCYPGTREEVISLVKKSIIQQDSEPRMLWLSGPAGAGKSAIMQTVAEQCKEQGIPHANFFFFRADESRSDARAFVATIMHQIIKLYPSVGPAVAAVLESDPLLFQMSIKEQFDVLLHSAFPTVQDTTSPPPPLALLIDGLDECDSGNKAGQQRLLQALDALLVQKWPSFRVVVASRVEPQISMAFSNLHSEVDSIFLDEKYSPEKDIHRFVSAEFEKIKSNPYFSSTLDADWPLESDVAAIVSKSSGQFIYAATVMRFIMYSSTSPVISLQRVQGIVPATKNSPFAQLDAVYTYILEQVDNWEATKTMLAVRLLGEQYIGCIWSAFMPYQSASSYEMFKSCRSELASLIKMNDTSLDFFHASFPDFLRDKTRSRVYHVDLETFCDDAIPVWWRRDDAGLFSTTLRALGVINRPTAKMSAALIELNPTLQRNLETVDIKLLSYQLDRIYGPHDPQLLSKIMHAWVSANPKIAKYLPQKFFQSVTFKGTSNITTPTTWAPPSTPQTPLSTPQMPLPTPHMPPSTSQMLPAAKKTTSVRRWGMRLFKRLGFISLAKVRSRMQTPKNGTGG